MLNPQRLNENMKIALSIAVFVASCLVTAYFLFVAVTAIPYAVTQDSEGWGTMVFKCFYGPIIAGVALLFGVIPSAILFTKGHGRLDRVSLWMSTTTLSLVIVVWALIEPMRNWIIFGK